MKKRNIVSRGSNSITGRNKALWFVGTKIFTETEAYAAFDINTSATGNVSNRGISAYGVGGDVAGGPSRYSWKFLVVGETASLLGATALSSPRAYISNGGDNFGVAGFVAGGLGSGYAPTGTCDRVSYSTDTYSAATAITARGYLTAFSNSGSAAYHAGGYGGSTGQTYVTIVNKRLYSNDTISTITAMATGRQYPHSFSNHGTAGYVMGGQTTGGAQTNSIEKYVFSNDSRSTLSATLSIANYAGSGGALIGVRGYSFTGSDAANANPTARCDRLTFSNDTRSTLSNVLSATWYGSLYENG